MSQDLERIRDLLEQAESNASSATTQMGKFGKSVSDARDAMEKFGNATNPFDKLTASLKTTSSAFGAVQSQMKLVKAVKKNYEKAVESVRVALNGNNIALQQNTTVQQQSNAVQQQSNAVQQENNTIQKQSIGLKQSETTALVKATTARKVEKVSTQLATAQTKANTVATQLQNQQLVANKAFLLKKTAATQKQTAMDKLMLKGTLAQTKADGKQLALLKLKTAWYTLTTKGLIKATIAKIAKTAATTALAIAKMALPFMAVIAGIGALINIGARLISWFSRAEREARAHARAVEELSDQYERSTEEITADMERMGTTCVDTWSAVENATQNAAKEFGRCADEVRGEIADLVYKYGSYEEAIASWEASNLEAIQEVATQWGVSAHDIKDSLGEIDLDEWVEKQEAHLSELSDAWNISAADIQATLEEQGISLEQWEAGQMEILSDLEDQWGVSTDEIKAQMTAQGMSADQWTAHMAQAWDNFNSEVARNVDSIVNGFRTIPTEHEKTSAELRAIMDGNIATTREWQNNMVEIASRVSPEMLAWLESKGPEFNSVVYDMLHTPGELESWVQSFDDATELGMTQALNNVDCNQIRDALVSRLDREAQAVRGHTGLGDSYEEMLNTVNERAAVITRDGGENAGTEFIDGAISLDYSAIPDTVSQELEAGKDGMIKPMKSTVDAIQEIMEIGMTEIESVVTSKLAKVKETFASLPTRLSPSARQAVQIVRDMARNKAEALRNANTIFRNAGGHLMDGLRAGILSREDSLMATAKRIATNITKTLQRAFQINSPSRLMREKIGRFIPEGVAVGIDKYADVAVDSVTKLGHDMVGIKLPSVESMIGMKPSLQYASAGVSSSYDNRINHHNHNYAGLFDGAKIQWNGEEDIRRTMEKMIRATEEDSMRMW